GIPVPDDDRNQMMYVWCEELSNYISALGYGTSDKSMFDMYWPADLHIVGKDILRFHAIVWPAMLLSAGLALPKTILAHGMIISGGKKMSKTIGNVIDPHEYIDTYGVDAFRYYLAREISPFEDGDFTKDKFIEVYNANLANGLGNLVSRTLKMAEKYFDGNVSRKMTTDVPLRIRRESLSGTDDLGGYSIPYTIQKDILPQYQKKMDAFDIQKASDVAWELIGILDGYITDHEPFKLIKKDPEKTENILWNVLFGISVIADMIAPIMPKTSKEIKKVIAAHDDGKGSTVFQTVPLSNPLFSRIEIETKK
ncbi:MAG: methionine--tRNA ligase, partial [Candidatus Pacebacteria bacterium]|nr:methionine--tRNA ligase [Candidatus Paceibacterota bacterium]